MLATYLLGGDWGPTLYLYLLGIPLLGIAVICMTMWCIVILFSCKRRSSSSLLAAFAGTFATAILVLLASLFLPLKDEPRIVLGIVGVGMILIAFAALCRGHRVRYTVGSSQSNL